MRYTFSIQSQFVTDLCQALVKCIEITCAIVSCEIQIIRKYWSKLHIVSYRVKLCKIGSNYRLFFRSVVIV